MGSDTFLILLGGLLAVAFLAEEAFGRIRVPPVIVLMACGLLLGPVAKLLPAERFTVVAPHLGALALTAALAAAIGLPPVRAFALGLILAPVSGSIVLPLAGRLGLSESIRTVVVLEAALADVLAVLGMELLGRLITSGGFAGLVALGSLFAAGFSVLLAVGLGLA